MSENQQIQEPVRTRFAPSPSGFLHIGSARTALFNWAYARRAGGTYVLRVEDTDQDRSTEESERQLLEGMSWLGIDWDEGPFRQSERGARHREAVAELLESGQAYRCICTRDELEVRRQETIAAGGKMDVPVRQRVFWCVLGGLVAAALMLGGGINSLQSMTISIALPFGVVLLLMAVGLYQGLWLERGRQSTLS